MTTPRRILVVDDNTDSASSLEKLLTMTGHEVRSANDGLTGVAEAERFRPEVVLLDIGLPRLNGYDACRLIREQPWGANMILIAVTGWGQEEDRRRSREAGFDGHLVKPVDLDELTRLLDEVALDRKP
jgi:DNA-binding response OmpR family regulator